MPAIHRDHCPGCHSTDLSELFLCQDHTVSKEKFAVWACANCGGRFTQNVPDEASIGSYYQSEDYISHSNTSRGLINRLYQMVRTYTVKKKVELIKRESGKEKGSLLDVGCGTGQFLAGMKSAGWTVSGLEPDPGARKLASEAVGEIIEEPEGLFADRPTVGVITLWHVLEHVHRLHEYLDRFHALLQPGGLLLIAVPNFTSADATHYGADWAAYDVPRHLYHFSPESMAVLMSQHGFRIDRHLPMPFDAFYVSMLSEQIRHGKPRLISAFFAGFSSWLVSRSKVERGSSVLYVIRKG